MSLRTGKPFEDFEKSGEGDYHDFLYDQYIALQKEIEELNKLLYNPDMWKELKIKYLKKENEELKKHIDPFWDEEPPKGLDPTFYRTLSYEGDMKIYNKIQALKEQR